MKQLLFTILLVTLALGLSAQTGLFGISFGQSRAEAQKMLTQSGFIVDESKDDEISFSNPKIEGLTDLSVEFDSEGGVSGWEIK